MRAAAESSPVVADAAKPCEGGLVDQGAERIRDVGAVDEQHRLTRPHHLVGELDAVDLGAFHRLSLHLVDPDRGSTRKA
jgi:hypothetical protein